MGKVKCSVCKKEIEQETFDGFGGACPECEDRDCKDCIALKQRDKSVSLLESIAECTAEFLDKLKEADDGS